MSKKANKSTKIDIDENNEQKLLAKSQNQASRPMKNQKTNRIAKTMNPNTNLFKDDDDEGDNDTADTKSNPKNNKSCDLLNNEDSDSDDQVNVSQKNSKTASNKSKSQGKMLININDIISSDDEDIDSDIAQQNKSNTKTNPRQARSKKSQTNNIIIDEENEDSDKPTPKPRQTRAKANKNANNEDDENEEQENQQPNKTKPKPKQARGKVNKNCSEDDDENEEQENQQQNKRKPKPKQARGKANKNRNNNNDDDEIEEQENQQQNKTKPKQRQTKGKANNKYNDDDDEEQENQQQEKPKPKPRQPRGKANNKNIEDEDDEQENQQQRKSKPKPRQPRGKANNKNNEDDNEQENQQQNKPKPRQPRGKANNKNNEDDDEQESQQQGKPKPRQTRGKANNKNNEDDDGKENQQQNKPKPKQTRGKANKNSNNNDDDNDGKATKKQQTKPKPKPKRTKESDSEEGYEEDENDDEKSDESPKDEKCDSDLKFDSRTQQGRKIIAKQTMNLIRYGKQMGKYTVVNTGGKKECVNISKSLKNAYKHSSSYNEFYIPKLDDEMIYSDVYVPSTSEYYHQREFCFQDGFNDEGTSQKENNPSYTSTNLNNGQNLSKRLTAFSQSSQTPLCSIEVVDNPCTEAAKILVRDEHRKTCIINFSLPLRPLDSFMDGDQSQDDCLLRQAGIYSIYKKFISVQQRNLEFKDGAYTDAMIYASRVPVFRSALKERLLTTKEVFEVSVITAALPDITKPMCEKVGSRVFIESADIKTVLENRMRKMMMLAAEKKNEALVIALDGKALFEDSQCTYREVLRDLIIKEGLGRFFEKIVISKLGKDSLSFKEIQANF